MRNSSSTNVSLTKRPICLFACCLVLPAVIAAQGPPPPTAHEIKTEDSVTAVVGHPDEQEIPFAGGVLLRIGRDSMNDTQTCSLSTTADQAWIDSSGLAAVITAGSDVDYSRPALLRIDEDAPIALNVQHRRSGLVFHDPGTRELMIPAERSAEFVRALYAHRRLRLRYSVFPGPGRFDEEIRFGDFAAGYDRGVERCHWPKMRIAAGHPSPELVAALTLDYMPEPASTPAAPIKDWYLDAVRRRVEENWLTSTMSSPTPGSFHAVVTFSIARDGSLNNIRLERASREYDVDASVQRAVLSSDPMPPLPTSYVGASASLRAEFEAKLAPHGVLFHAVEVRPQAGP